MSHIIRPEKIRAAARDCADLHAGELAGTCSVVEVMARLGLPVDTVRSAGPWIGRELIAAGWVKYRPRTAGLQVLRYRPAGDLIDFMVGKAKREKGE